MGMTKASLDFQIQKETQKSISILQQNMMHLDKILQIVDGNMRQSHMVLFQDITQLRVRVNFIMGELKNGMTEEEEKALEARFMEFAKGEAAKMEASVAKAIGEREAAAATAEAEAKKQGTEAGSENTKNVIV
jgi:hypothetical protein